MALSSSSSIRETTTSFVSAGDSIRVERFEPQSSQPRPAVLVLHGSDGMLYRADTYRGIARDLAADGYPAFLLHYFDSAGKPTSLQTAPLSVLRWLQAITDAISYATAQPSADPGRVGLLGFSLGAYLALAVAVQDARVAAVVECSGGLHELIIPSLETLPPVLILHGALDRVVPVTEASHLEEHLVRLGVAYEKQIYPNQGHTFTGQAASGARHRARLFLEQHLGPDGSR